jgi:hypothetical protein
MRLKPHLRDALAVALLVATASCSRTPNKDASRFAASLSKISLAYYTVSTGDNDNAATVVKDAPSRVFDCYFFTDNEQTRDAAARRGWKAVMIDGPPVRDAIGSCMKSKSLRTRPQLQRELQSYRYLVMIDSKIVHEVHDVRTLQVIASLQPNKSIVHRQHFGFAKPPYSVWAEFDLSMEQERYRLQANQMRHYINTMTAAGYNATKVDAHLMGGYIIRDMRHPQTAGIGDIWYQNILSCGIQDQISLFFVHQMFHDAFHVIPPYPI